MAVFLCWCSCGGVVVFLWWCLAWCFCGGVVVFLWWCVCGGVPVAVFKIVIKDCPKFC